MSGFAGMVGRADESACTRMATAIAHRGPDRQRFVAYPRVYFVQFESTSSQPPWSRPLPLDRQEGRCRMLWDGTLFSNPQRGDGPLSPEAVARQFQEDGFAALGAWDGMYAFALYDTATDDVILARDPLGIKPLYYGYGSDGTLYFASEMKALLKATQDVRYFPPGYVFHSRRGWYRFYDIERTQAVRDNPRTVVPELQEALEKAVQKQMNTDGIGTFLSGGLDSSLIAALARRCVNELPSFAVGVKDCPDLRAAREVAAVVGTKHYEYQFTKDEVIAALPDVIYTLESFDPALVRGAVATHFAARLAKDYVKVVLSGEGADELFGGYQYLRAFSPASELSRELVRITTALHHTGLQRVDRLTSRYGLDVRLPFLDRTVVDLAFSLSASLKGLGPDRVEKWIVRRAGRPYLPPSILWRAKEKFAVGTGTAQIMKEWAEGHISDTEYRRNRFLPGNFEVKSKEELFYYKIFREFFDADAAIAAIGRSRSLDPAQRYA